MEIDISRSCRSCLCKSNDMHPICKSVKSYEIFGSVEKDSYMGNMSIAEVVMACTAVNISPDDGLPQSVCTQCLHQIQQAFQFKEKCEAADLKLRHYSLNKADPISCIKTENDELDRLFQPETVLVTEFGVESDLDDEPMVDDVDDDRLVIKREKKQRNDSVEKTDTKVKIEQLPNDVDEKTLIEEAEIVDGRYQCKFCEKSLADRQTYKLHIRLHTGANLKRCTICDRGFAKKNHLERHLATHDETHKCKSCTKAFLSIDEQKTHEKTCRKPKQTESSKVKDEDEIEDAEIVDGRYQCKYCEKSLADRQTYRLHIRLHTGTNLKRCTICDRGFTKKNHLERHLATHDETHKCSFCTRAFLTTSELKDHDMLCTKSNRQVASKVKDEYEIRNLQTSKSGTGVGTRFTGSKGRVSNETDEQSEHDEHTFDPDDTNESDEQMVKRKDQGYKRMNVGEIPLRTKIPLDDEEQHLIQSAKIVNDRYECPICSKTLARREILVLHVRTHTGKNLLRCSICDKGFAKQYNLNRHMLLHDGDNNVRMDKAISEAKQPDGSFCCTFCMKVFTERQSFRFHLRMHTLNKLKHCDICNQSFAEEEELLLHMPVHGDYFPCIECDEVFKTFRDRKEHSETVHTTKTKKISNAKKPRPSKEASDEDEKLVNSAELINGRYNCKFCEKTLANRSTLKLHIRLHLQKKLKICKHCGHGFSKNSHLERHMKTHFPKKLECKVCHATFASLQEMKSHTATEHKDEMHSQKMRRAIVPWTQPNGKKVCQCMICDSVFDNISVLRKHLTWHANTMEWIQEVDLKSKVEYLQMFDELKDGEFTNEDIAKVLQTKLTSDSHEVLKMYRITNDQGWELSFTDSETETEMNDDNERKRIYDCNECPFPRSYDRLYKLMCHLKADHQTISKQFQCTHCLQCFPNSEILAKHLRQQCENKTKTLHCTMCYSRFTWASSLASHFNVYHQSESKVLGANISRQPHACNLCSKSFYTEQQLNGHQLRHLPREKRFACDICDKKFSRFDNMRTHMRSHIPSHERENIAKTHLCSYCGQGFSNLSNLNVHVRKHTGERPFKCDICNSSFRRSCDLSCHRRTHTGEKPYPCLVCGHRFSRSNKLVRHMRIHTGERPYKCTECDRAFTQSNDLTLHIRRHTGDKPFHCICGERYITNSLLQQHRRTHAH